MRTFFRYSEEEAQDYDRTVHLQIPHYREMHAIARRFFPYNDRLGAVRHLELGIGTGNLTQTILEGHSNVLVDAFDVSATMLDIAKQKLLPFRGRIRFHHADIFEAEFSTGYHAATLFLCEDQRQIFSPVFFNKVAHALLDEGRFIVCCHNSESFSLISESSDQFCAPNENLTLMRVWKFPPFSMFSYCKEKQRGLKSDVAFPKAVYNPITPK